MSQIKNLTIAGLALVLLTLVVLLHRQSEELQRLRESRTHADVMLPVITVRRATDRQVAFPPLRPGDLRTEDRPVTGYNGDFGFVPERRAPPPRRPRNLAQLIENPEFVGALTTYQQSALDARFASLFRKLNLSAEELAAFKKLLAQKESAEFDVVAIGETVADHPLSSQELNATVRTVQAEVEREIQSALGSDRYAIYRDYAETLPQRATVAQLEQRLSYSPTPLTPKQSEEMVRLLASASSPADPVVATPTVMVGSGDISDSVPVVRRSLFAAVVTDEAVASAQSVLSPEQVAALAQIQTEQQAALRATQLLRAADPGLTVPQADWKSLLQ